MGKLNVDTALIETLAELLQRTGLTEIELAEGDSRIRVVRSPQPLTAAALAALVQYRLGRAPTVVEGDGRPIQRIAWCTGGAQGYFEAAIEAGADAYLTGEISEPQAHIARENANRRLPGVQPSRESVVRADEGAAERSRQNGPAADTALHYIDSRPSRCRARRPP